LFTVKDASHKHEVNKSSSETTCFRQKLLACLHIKMSRHLPINNWWSLLRTRDLSISNVTCFCNSFLYIFTTSDKNL